MFAYIGRWEDREVEGFARAVVNRFEPEDVALVPTRGDISVSNKGGREKGRTDLGTLRRTHDLDGIWPYGE